MSRADNSSGGDKVQKPLRPNIKEEMMVKKRKVITIVVKTKTTINQREAVIIVIQMSQPKVKKGMMQMNKVRTKKMLRKIKRVLKVKREII